MMANMSRESGAKIVPRSYAGIFLNGHAMLGAALTEAQLEGVIQVVRFRLKRAGMGIRAEVREGNEVNIVAEGVADDLLATIADDLRAYLARFDSQ